VVEVAHIVGGLEHHMAAMATVSAIRTGPLIAPQLQEGHATIAAFPADGTDPLGIGEVLRLVGGHQNVNKVM